MADRTFTAGSLATWVDRDQCPPIDLDFCSALITPPQPFAEAERKASPNTLSINPFCGNCLRPKTHFSL